MSQPARLLVILKENKVKLPPGFTRLQDGPFKGKKAYTFHGLIGHADMIGLKFTLQDMGAEVKLTWAGKGKKSCTMYCGVPHHPSCTEECRTGRKQ